MFKDIIKYLEKVCIICKLLTIYYIGIIFIGVLCCLINFHFKKYNYLPTISEMMVYYPESLIFSYGMSIGSILLIIFGIIKNNHIKEYFNNKIIRILMFILIIISSLSMIFLSFFSILQYKNIHIFSTGIFFLSTSLYFILSDIIYSDSLSKFSKSIPYLSFFCFIFVGFIKYILKFSPKTLRYSLASIFEYIGIILILFKFQCFKKTCSNISTDFVP